MSQYYCKRKFIYSVKGLDCPHDQWGLTEPFHKNIVFPWRFTEGSDGDREKCQYPTPSLIPTLWIKSMCNCFPFFKFLTINEYKHATWTCYYINVVIMPVDPPTTARIHCNFKLRFRILEAFRSCIFFGITLKTYYHLINSLCNVKYRYKCWYHNLAERLYISFLNPNICAKIEAKFVVNIEREVTTENNSNPLSHYAENIYWRS